MKSVLLCSTLFCVIAIPAIGELTDADLDKIRLIVNDIVNDAEERIKKEVKAEIAITHTKIEALDTRLRNVETDIAELRGSKIAFSAMKDWLIALCAVAALIVSIIALRKKQPTLPPTTQDTSKAVSQ